MNLDKAQAARTATAMGKSVWVDERPFTFTELLGSGAIAYVRTRIFSNGKRTYGVILHADISGSPETSPFYDAPKMVTDALENLGIDRVVIGA